MARTLEQWLQFIEQLHPRSIELGLERVRRVYGALGSPRPAPLVVSVAGTNGKGSCVAWIESVARAAGYRTMAYTSPHLQRYNERVRIDAQSVADTLLVDAFERVDDARGDVPLTFFEFGTLAALVIGHEASVDLAVLEVGLGGRLDAVNVIDADVAIVTSVGLDHCDWLGPDRETIGREKAGIFRSRRPAVFGDPDMPASVAGVADAVGARLLRVGVDFDYQVAADDWDWRSRVTHWQQLPGPPFGGREQYRNLSCALAALEQLAPQLRLQRDVVARGITGAQLPGRFQRIGSGPEWILDVAHNAEAAASLAAALASQPVAGRTLALAGLMRGKPVTEFAGALADQVDEWWITAADNERALPAAECARLVRAGVREPVHEFACIAGALAGVLDAAGPRDRIVVTGSFLVVGAVMDYLSQHGHRPSG